MVVRIIGALLVIWLAFMLFGFLFKALFWLALLGGAAFAVTAGIGYAKRHSISR